MFLKNTASVFATQIITFGLTFLANVILTRTLGPAGRGQITLLNTVVAILSLISSLGIGSASIYYLNRNKETSSTIASTAIMLQMLFTSVTMVLAISLTPWLVNSILKAEVTTLLLLLSFFTMPLTTLSNVVSNLLLGISKIDKHNYSRIIQNGIQLALLIILLVLFRLSVAGAVTVAGFSAVCGAVVGFYWLRQQLKLKINLSKTWTQSLLSYGIKAWAGSVLQYFNYRLDVFVVNLFVGVVGVGQYSVAVTLAESIWYIPNAVSLVLFPKTAADWDIATQFTPIVTRNTAFIIIVTAIGLSIISFPLIKIVYGAEFLPAVTPLLALLPGIVFLGVGKVLASDLAGRGKPHYGTWSAFSALVLTILFDFLLIPKMQITGAAIASTLSYGLSSSILLYLYLKLSGNTIGSVLVLKTSDLKRYSETIKRIVGKIPPEKL